MDINQQQNIVMMQQMQKMQQEKQQQVLVGLRSTLTRMELVFHVEEWVTLN